MAAPDLKPDRAIADMEGGAALPRKNGELVFDETWEARVFGIAIAMHEDGRFAWNEFRDLLIEETAASDRAGADVEYYERWLTALERLLANKHLVSPSELDLRVAQIESGERDDVF
ncbi:MAG: nitrile hydratase accessory protein [Chloroflexota bacterium]